MFKIKQEIILNIKNFLHINLHCTEIRNQYFVNNKKAKSTICKVYILEIKITIIHRFTKIYHIQAQLTLFHIHKCR